MPGKFQKDFSLKKDKLYDVDIVVVGDIVKYSMNKDGSGVINEVLPRRNHISRKAPRIKGASTRGERLEQKIAANIDNLIIISSCKEPSFNNRIIDRLIVTAESSHLNCIIVINKIDLDRSNHRHKFVDLYKSIGYEVFETSVIQKIGIEELRKSISGKVNLFWGQSGVGKSSLLNAMYPGLNLRIGEISGSTSKGKHITVTSVLIKVGKTTSVIDTPGIREIDPYGIKSEDLGHYFKDFLKFLNECKFNTCTHHHEPGCAVLKAVDEGMISEERYVSYLNLLQTIEDDMNF